MDAISEFKEVLNGQGILASQIIADGDVHRVKTALDKGSAKSGWYILFDDGLIAGSFGNWKTGQNENWCSKSAQNLSATERAQAQAAMEKAQDARKTETEKLYCETAEVCQKIWESAASARAYNPYLIKKGIGAFCLKEWRDKDVLLVPVFQNRNEIASLQFIYADGTKKFKTGGKVSGGYCLIGDATKPTDKRIYFCEGYATGATLFEALNALIVVCFNAGNMARVAEKMRPLIPAGREFVFCVDKDDSATGLLAGCEASLATDGRIVVPDFGDAAGSDFNDLAVLKGVHIVREQIVKQLDTENRCTLSTAQAQAVKDSHQMIGEINKTVSEVNALFAKIGLQINLQKYNVQSFVKQMHQAFEGAVIES